MFSTGLWTQEIRCPHDIFFFDEAYQTFQSYLKGWNFYTTSEATVWHNYNYKNTETDKPYRVVHTTAPDDYEDNTVAQLNKLLLEGNEGKYERTLEQCEKYFQIKFRLPVEHTRVLSSVVGSPKIEILENPAKTSKEHMFKEWKEMSKKIISRYTNVKKSRKNIQLKRR